jgi:hypothetical protein
VVIDGNVEVAVRGTGLGTAMDWTAAAAAGWDYPRCLPVELEQSAGGASFVAPLGCPARADALPLMASSAITEGARRGQRSGDPFAP